MFIAIYTQPNPGAKRFLHDSTRKYINSLKTTHTKSSTKEGRKKVNVLIGKEVRPERSGRTCQTIGRTYSTPENNKTQSAREQTLNMHKHTQNKTYRYTRDIKKERKYKVCGRG